MLISFSKKVSKTLAFFENAFYICFSIYRTSYNKIMRIKKKILEKIKTDTALRAKLCATMGKAYPTIQKYVNENHELLTTASALEVIKEHFGLTYEQVIERSKTSV